jgi:primosomal protein N' (replication factor Y)
MDSKLAAGAPVPFKYAEVVVDRPIVKRSRRDFVDSGETAAVPPPEMDSVSDAPSEAEENPLAVTFHYHIPPPLAGRLRVGHLVAVPFRTQQLTAVVVGLSQSSPISPTRPVGEILDPEPVLTPAQINLARWLSDEFLAPLASCVKYFLPPGSGRKPETRLKALDAAPTGSLSAQEQLLFTYLRQRGTVSLDDVNRNVADNLINKGLAITETVLSKPRVGPKIERMVELLIPPEEVEAALPTLGRRSKQADILLFLADSDDPLPPLTQVLEQVDCSISPVKALAEKGYIEIIPAETRLDVTPEFRHQAASQLTDVPAEQKVLGILLAQGRPVSLAEVVETANLETEEPVNNLEQKKLIARFSEPEQIRLTIPVDDVLDTIVELRHATKQADVLNLLASEDGPVWVGWVYAQTEANLNTLRSLAGAGLVNIDETRRWRDPLAGHSFVLDKPPKLTQEQQAVWEEVSLAWRPKRPVTLSVLLHGVTGSGKTEIYLRAAAAALRAGQGVIFLVPEITLATQTVERVSARFPGRVAVWHSALSPGERYDTWERVRGGELQIVVGPRSALFAPVRSLGLIIVDEEHEPAYKQRDRPPVFHARDAALKLGQLNNALVLLGSATPDVASYRRAERGEYRLLHLPNRILAHTKHLAVQQALLKRGKTIVAPAPGSDFVALPLPPVEVVDMREELKAGNRTIFSRSLQDAIRTTLKRGEQAILFLNRRGTASFVICRDCGYVMACPRCETTLTYHASNELMVCHYCGYRMKPAATCPTCHSERIRYFGLGTQRVEDAVSALFPQARTIRWDWDTTRQKGSHHLFLQQFVEGKANIMVGTQMVAKGLDLPLVTLVGVISADTALYLPDFRAAERSFQLLMQVAGRAGRSPLGGRVIVQTYNPDQVAIEAAANHDYEGFYQMELGFRREQRYPPFKRLALLLYSGPGYKKSGEAAHYLVDRLRRHVERMGLPAVEIIGPTPSYIRRVNNQYRWHVLVRAYDPPAVLRPLMPLPRGWKIDIDPVSLL